jgi:hypothetical protein
MPIGDPPASSSSSRIGAGDLDAQRGKRCLPRLCVRREIGGGRFCNTTWLHD